ncbi:YjiH family protein [Lysinibacillus sp. LZ02]|uniref:YjiH family protein n=1 Tax=Lysinibacillus sp. LZ02 TaxID=3420668 RepID=UPI003D366277
MPDSKVPQVKTTSLGIFKFLGFSLIGILAFFIPFEINGASSILLDHIVTYIRNSVPTFVTYFALIVLLLGAALPFYEKTWSKSITDMILSVFKVIGAVAGLMLVFDFGPAWLFEPDLGPYLYEKLIKPVSLLVPIGGVFLAFLVGYGLLEFIGVFMQPIMRPLFKTPGRSAIDAVASFVGSYSLGILITNRIYLEGKYTKREAAIIVTGFSTVSVTFMVVIAKTLELMDIWLTYFWVSLIITFTVTAITTRIPPISRIPNECAPGATPQPEKMIKKERFKHAWAEAMEVVNTTPALPQNIWINLRDGLRMVMNILPTIMSVGLLGMLLALYTPVFDVIGLIFYPFTWALQMPEPMLTAKAAALSVSEIFLPALIAAGSMEFTRFVVAVVSVSAILFFSAMIPCILSTEIKVSIPHLIFTWFVRVVLTLILVTPVAMILF